MMEKNNVKGKLSPRHMVHPRAALLTSFMGMPPPLAPTRGSAAPGTGLAIGGVGGYIKLELPTK